MKLLILFVPIFLMSTSGFGKQLRKVNPKDVSLLRSIEGKYQKGQGIIADLKRTVSLEALGTQKKSRGKVFINRGRMHLAIQSPVPEKVVLDGRWIWMVSPPPKEFKNAKTQVLKASMKSKQARSQGLLQILTQGKFLKYFDISGVEKLNEKTGFWLQPGSSSKEFKRAKLVVSTKSNEIVELSFWDNRGNKTTYEFLKTKFGQKIPGNKFKYTPPKNAEVISESGNV